MIFEKQDLSEGCTIPVAALKLSGFDADEAAEYHTLTNAVVVLKKRMNALELIRAVWSLYLLSTELSTSLSMLCFPHGNCAECSEDGEFCPYDTLDFAMDFDLPSELLERAGIPEDAPLHAELLDDGEITISTNRDGPGLWDVPAPLMKGLLGAGICPSILKELLASGEVVYGA